MVDTQMYIMACVFLMLSAVLFLLWQCRSAILARILPPEDLEIGAEFSFPIHDIISPTGTTGAPAGVIAQLPVFRYSKAGMQHVRQHQQQQHKHDTIKSGACGGSSPHKHAASQQEKQQQHQQHSSCGCASPTAKLVAATLDPAPTEPQEQQQEQLQHGDVGEAPPEPQAQVQKRMVVPAAAGGVSCCSCTTCACKQLQSQCCLGQEQQQPDQRGSWDVLGNRVGPAPAEASPPSASSPSAPAADNIASSPTLSRDSSLATELPPPLPQQSAAQDCGEPHNHSRSSSSGCAAKDSVSGLVGARSSSCSQRDSCCKGTAAVGGSSADSKHNCCCNQGHESAASSTCGGSDSGQDGALSCVICFADYAEGDLVKQLPCQHCFHSRCIDTWLRRSGNCPLCKMVLWRPRSPYVLFHF